MPMLRKDPITGRWVIIATERAKRPRSHGGTSADMPGAFCPFCAGHEASTPAPVATYDAVDAQSDHDWSVRVVPNKFPALSSEGDLAAADEGPYEGLTGVGTHDVIIECPEHIVDMGQLSVPHIAAVLRAWKERIEALRGDGRLECAVVFKNHGAAAGASLEHAHSQLIGLPVVPKRLAEELVGSQRYFDDHGECVFCDVLAYELDGGERVVCANDEAVAVAPFASRFPFELWILPRRHQAWYEDAHDEVFESVASLLKQVLGKLDRALEQPPFNLMLHSAPFPNGEDVSHFHWHFELIPKLTKVAGFEWGTGFYINPTSPESAAEHLRDIQLD
jgi:UDPglucose--hexose-1-phosphate uridylyltransferase